MWENTIRNYRDNEIVSKTVQYKSIKLSDFINNEHLFNNTPEKLLICN